MKYYIYLSLVIMSIIAMGCRDSPENTDWELYNLTGRIKSIQETTHKRAGTGGDLLNDLKKQHTINTAFNKKGYKTEEVKYDPIGNLVERMYYEYEYDESGHKNKRYNYNTEGELTSIYTYQYDKYGIVEENRYNTDGELFLRKSYEVYYLPDDFKVVEEKVYNSGNNLVSETSCTYDNHGVIQRLIRMNDHFSFMTDDDGLTIYEIIEFDERGNEKTITYPRLFTQDRTFEYEFDKKDNWIIKKVFQHGQLKTIVNREIVFY